MSYRPMKVGKSVLVLEHDAPPGAVELVPEVHLSSEAAALQLRLWKTLREQGLELPKQGDVYPWILGEMQRKLDASKPGEVPDLFGAATAR